MSISTIATISGVEEKTTTSGKALAKFKDGSGTEYAAFEPPLIKRIKQYEGQTVHLDYDETHKNGYVNRYVRNITPIEDQPSDSGPVPNLVEPTVAQVAQQGPNNTDWFGQVVLAAQKGDWRAADALARQEHIERSVALNKAVDFFQYLKEEDRQIKNLDLIFEHILKVLRDK